MFSTVPFRMDDRPTLCEPGHRDCRTDIPAEGKDVTGNESLPGEGAGTRGVHEAATARVWNRKAAFGEYDGRGPGELLSRGHRPCHWVLVPLGHLRSKSATPNEGTPGDLPETKGSWVWWVRTSSSQHVLHWPAQFLPVALRKFNQLLWA